MTRLFLASIALVSTLAVVPYAVEAQKPTPKKGALPNSNQVYVKIILPTDPATGWVAAQEPAPALRSFETGGAEHLALSPDGTFVVATTYHAPSHSLGFGHREVRLLRMEQGKSGKSLLLHSSAIGFPNGVAIAPDGKRVAVTWTSVDGNKVVPDVRDAYTTEVGIWDTATGKRTATLAGSKAQQLHRVAFSHDGKYVAAGVALMNKTAQPDGGGVAVWRADTGESVWSNLEHKAIQTELTFSPDGKLLATAGDDRMIRVWDALTGKALKAIETRDYYVRSISFSPNGKLLAGGGGDGAARVWDVATGKEKQVLKGYKKSGNVAEQLFVRFLPDGALLTAGSAEKADGSLKVWDVETGNLVKAIADPNRSLWWMDLTADGKTAVVATHVVGTWRREQRLLIVSLTK